MCPPDCMSVAPDDLLVHVTSRSRREAACGRGPTCAMISCPRRRCVFLACDLLNSFLIDGAADGRAGPAPSRVPRFGEPHSSHPRFGGAGRLRYQTAMGSWTSMSLPVVWPARCPRE